MALTAVNIYLKEDRGSGFTPQYLYHHLESEPIHGLIDHWEWYYFLATGVHGESYAVNWTLPSGLVTPATPVDADAYFAPIPDPEHSHSNVARLTREHVRRVMLTLRQHGERTILFRRKISGTQCKCYSGTLNDVLRDCSDCYGTGFVGGYDLYPRILFRFIPAGTKLSANEFGIMVDTSPRAWMFIVPEITDRDMLVRTLPVGRLRAYEIHNVTRKPLEGPSAVEIIQEFSLKQMEAYEPIYRAMADLLPSALLPAETGIEPGLPRRHLDVQ